MSRLNWIVGFLCLVYPTQVEAERRKRGDAEHMAHGASALKKPDQHAGGSLRGLVENAATRS